MDCCIALNSFRTADIAMDDHDNMDNHGDGVFQMVLFSDDSV